MPRHANANRFRSISWLHLAHKRLDEAVFAAYGWRPDLSDEEILERLLALNLERGKKIGKGVVLEIGD